MSVKIVSASFDPWQEVSAFQTQHSTLHGQYGATNIFIGTMRDFNAGEQVQGMTLEYYPGMTEKQLAKIVVAAKQQWQLLECLIVHRVGDILPNQPIVVVAVWSSHRGDAFDACRFIMEDLKSKAPFWKKDLLANNQSRWQVSNSNGYAKSEA